MEARMKLPTGQGVWSAFWMLGEDFPTSGWPDCGEIDIMENIGEPRTVYGTVHGPGYSGGGGIGDSFTADVSLSEDFHTYAIEWEPGEIRWYLDDSLFNTITDTQVPGEWVYDHPFFLLLNLAIGGNWPGYPDETTQFPQQFVIDYVRVYRDSTLSIEDLQEGVLYADDITMTLEKDEEDWEGVAYVTVLDSNGDPVEGAMVAAGWLGVVTGATGEATTNEKGVAGPFVGQKTSFADEITFCIADIRKTSYTYDEDANTRTCIFDSP
jgi:beta-glucanase (GH16 family)